MGRYYAGGVLLVIVLLARSASAETADAYHLHNMHKHPWFLEVMASSVVGWVLGLVKGFSGTKDWVEQYWTTPPKSLLFVADLVVFVVVGAYFGTGLFKPNEFLQALAAGITWPVGLGALASKS